MAWNPQLCRWAGGDIANIIPKYPGFPLFQRTYRCHFPFPLCAFFEGIKWLLREKFHPSRLERGQSPKQWRPIFVIGTLVEFDRFIVSIYSI